MEAGEGWHSLRIAGSSRLKGTRAVRVVGKDWPWLRRALSVAALQWWELEAEDVGHFPLSLAVSPSIASRLAAVKQTTPKSVERKIDAMACGY